MPKFVEMITPSNFSHLISKQNIFTYTFNQNNFNQDKILIKIIIRNLYLLVQ